MRKIIKVMKKLIFIVAIVGLVLAAIVAGSIAYYFIFALPTLTQEKIDLEKQKFDAEQREKAAKEAKQAEAELLEAYEKAGKDEAYNDCVFSAELAYGYSWDNECSAWKVEVDTAWKNCRALQFSFESDAENRQRCVGTTPDYNVDENGSCLLPNSRVEKLKEALKDAKDECFKLYK